MRLSRAVTCCHAAVDVKTSALVLSVPTINVVCTATATGTVLCTHCSLYPPPTRIIRSQSRLALTGLYFLPSRESSIVSLISCRFARPRLREKNSTCHDKLFLKESLERARTAITDCCETTQSWVALTLMLAPDIRLLLGFPIRKY